MEGVVFIHPRSFDVYHYLYCIYRYMLCDVEAGPDMAIKVKVNIKKISDVIRVLMITLSLEDDDE